MNVDIKNILIVRTDRIGDVVLTTPAIESLKKAKPEIKITLLVSPLTIELVAGNPYVEEVLVDDKNNEHKGLFGFIKLIKTIRQRKFDAVINFHTKKRTNAYLFMAQIPRRIGYKNNKFGFLLNDPVKDERHLGKKHEFEYCMDVIKHVIPDCGSGNMFVPVQESNELWVKELFSELQINQSKNIIAIHPGASDPSKRWPIEKFNEVIKGLQKRGCDQFIVVGSSDIAQISEQIKNENPKHIHDLTGKTTVGQLASVINHCSLLISNDSGPVHIAAGLNIPVVSIFTRNQPGINPERWQPLGEKSGFVSVPPNNDNSYIKAGEIEATYMEFISSEAVLEAVDAIFKLC